MTEANLPNLISSRICHDLISPIGAISNGMELLHDTSPKPSPEMELISESVTAANAKLCYFRIAFGHATTEAIMRSGDARKISDEMFAKSRLMPSWEIGEEELLRLEVKLAFLILMCIDSSMPLGGTVQIGKTIESLRFVATGTRVSVDEKLWGILQGHPVDHKLAPSEVQFALACDAMNDLGASLKTDLSEDRISLTIGL
jgi:histidine phosphotransferase ChpT